MKKTVMKLERLKVSSFTTTEATIVKGGIVETDMGAGCKTYKCPTYGATCAPVC